MKKKVLACAILFLLITLSSCDYNDTLISVCTEDSEKIIGGEIIEAEILEWLTQRPYGDVDTWWDARRDGHTIHLTFFDDFTVHFTKFINPSSISETDLDSLESPDTKEDERYDFSLNGNEVTFGGMTFIIQVLINPEVMPSILLECIDEYNCYGICGRYNLNVWLGI